MVTATCWLISMVAIASVIWGDSAAWDSSVVWGSNVAWADVLAGGGEWTSAFGE